jgi:predicted RNA binding protein YcfA (HicA-like mRNA interferase family)
MAWSSDDVAAVLRALGFELARRSGHDIYTRPGHPRSVSVPRDRRALPLGTLRSIWRQAGITPEEAERLR